MQGLSELESMTMRKITAMTEDEMIILECLPTELEVIVGFF